MKTSPDRAISRVETVSLGGYPQKILLEGRDAGLPVLLVLHGGPGSPLPFCVGSRGLFPEITEWCVLVCWDQYGCGANNAALPADISIADYAAMASELIGYLKKEFPQNRLYLFGMSWGSILSLLAANWNAGAVDGAVAYGQVSHRVLQSEDALSALLESTAPDKIKTQIKKIFVYGEFTPENAMKISRWVRKYTEGYVNSSDPQPSVFPLFRSLLKSPDYRLRDVLATAVNGYGKNKSLLRELSKADLRSELRHVAVPYHILQGETDIVTSTRQVEALVRQALNPRLTCAVVPGAGHLPGEKGMAAIFTGLRYLCGGARAL